KREEVRRGVAVRDPGGVKEQPMGGLKLDVHLGEQAPLLLGEGPCRSSWAAAQLTKGEFEGGSGRPQRPGGQTETDACRGVEGTRLRGLGAAQQLVVGDEAAVEEEIVRRTRAEAEAVPTRSGAHTLPVCRYDEETAVRRAGGCRLEGGAHDIGVGGACTG